MNTALTSPNDTAVVPFRLVPVISMTLPASVAPVIDFTELIVGAALGSVN